MRPVTIISIGQVPVRKRYERGLRGLGAAVVQQATAVAELTMVATLYASNMLADELQGQNIPPLSSLMKRGLWVLKRGRCVPQPPVVRRRYGPRFWLWVVAQ